MADKTAQIFTGLNHSIIREVDIFAPIIEAVEDERNQSMMLAPIVVSIQDFTLPDEQVQATWANYEGSGGQSVGKSQFSFSNTDNANTTPQRVKINSLLLRHGVQIFHLYAPEKVEKLDAKGKLVEYTNRPKLSMIQNLDSEDKSAPPGTNFFAEANRYNHLQDSSMSTMRLSMNFYGQEVHKFFTLEGNNSRKLLGANQIKIIKRTEKTIKEVIEFSGETEKQVRFWYTDSKITIVDRTEFLDEFGRAVNSKFLLDVKDTTILASKKCYGTVCVSYTVGYWEIALAYDVKDISRIIEISAGQIEEVGIVVKNEEDAVLQRLPHPNIPHDRVIEDKYLKLFPRITFRNPSLPSFRIFAFCASGVSQTSFSVPQPNYGDFLEGDLPLVNLFEERVRTRVFPSGGGTSQYVEFDVANKIVRINPHGKIENWSRKI